MSEKQRHNVIIFLTDQQRWDTSGLFGNPLELTPNFDRMAAKGTHFTLACSCQPVCGPARSSIQTGKYPTNTNTWKNGLALPKNENTIADYFSQVGYQTAYIGKWHLAGKEPGAVPKELRGGYQYWLAANIPEFVTEPYKTIMYDCQNNPVYLPGYRSDAIVDAAIRYINQYKDKTFFLFISTVEPHMQNQTDDFTPPCGYRKRYTGKWSPPDLAALGGASQQHLGGYWGMVKRLDEGLGRLFDALISFDILDNTIVAYASDHGCHFRTRNEEYKRSCHDSSIRVPMAITGPHFWSGGAVNHPFGLVDLPVTLLDAAGITVPEDMQGCSALPILKGQSDQFQEEVFIQISESQVARAVRTGRWTYCVSDMNKNGYEHSSSDCYFEEFLYDNESDPKQLNNLVNSASHAGIRRWLGESLIRRMDHAGEPIPKINKK